MVVYIFSSWGQLNSFFILKNAAWQHCHLTDPVYEFALDYSFYFKVWVYMCVCVLRKVLQEREREGVCVCVCVCSCLFPFVFMFNKVRP